MLEARTQRPDHGPAKPSVLNWADLPRQCAHMCQGGCRGLCIDQGPHPHDPRRGGSRPGAWRRKRKVRVRVRELVAGVYRVERRGVFGWRSCCLVRGANGTRPKDFHSEEDAREALDLIVAGLGFQPRVLVERTWWT